jgi:hypothetical protein
VAFYKVICEIELPGSKNNPFFQRLKIIIKLARPECGTIILFNYFVLFPYSMMKYFSNGPAGDHGGISRA